MLKKFASDALGLSDIGKIINKKDFDKVDADDYIEKNMYEKYYNYAKENNIIITEYYIDDGYSGYTMSRPDFNRLKEDLYENCKLHRFQSQFERLYGCRY